MKISEIITKVDSERIYQHILKLEGPKHPIDTPEKLNNYEESKENALNLVFGRLRVSSIK